jgi:hypothetical protein
VRYNTIAWISVKLTLGLKYEIIILILGELGILLFLMHMFSVCSLHASVHYSRSFLFYVDYFYLLTVHFPGISCSLSSATLPLLLIPTPYKLFAEIPTNSRLATRTYSGKIKSFADNLCFLDFSVSCQPLADNSNTWIFLSNVDKLLTFFIQ